MNYEKVEPKREGLPPFPDTDTLFRLEDGAYIRLRVTAKTSAGEVRNRAPEPGVAETINVKLQCSIAKDETGDVREEATGEADPATGKRHLILAAETQCITLEALAQKQVAFSAWLADRVDEILQKAANKRHVLDNVLGRYLFGGAAAG